MEVIRSQDPSPTMIEEGYKGGGEPKEERMQASGVVWKEDHESAIHSIRTGSVTLMVLNARVEVTGSHLTGYGGGGVGGVQDGAKGAAPANMAIGET
jgi:hypothetical protein